MIGMGVMSIKKAIVFGLSIFTCYFILATFISLWRNQKEQEKVDRYYQKISLGYNIMSKKKVIFAGIGYNIENSIPQMIRNVECTGSYFDDYRVIIYENDSKDKTKQLLKNWERKNNKVTIITEDIGKTSFDDDSFRTKVLAAARNHYLEVMRNESWKSYDYVIIFDTDISTRWELDGIAHSFGYTNNWDVMCANGIEYANGKYHDTFAFRDINGHHPTEDEIHIQYSMYDPLIPLRSCFGALAIYKKNVTEECMYSASGPEECEHVPFHKCLIEKHNAKLYFNPAMIIRYPG